MAVGPMFSQHILSGNKQYPRVFFFLLIQQRCFALPRSPRCQECRVMSEDEVELCYRDTRRDISATGFSRWHKNLHYISGSVITMTTWGCVVSGNRYTLTDLVSHLTTNLSRLLQSISVVIIRLLNAQYRLEVSNWILLYATLFPNFFILNFVNWYW